MGLIIFALSVIGFICLVLWIKILPEWFRVEKYRKEHQKDIENTYKEVSMLLNKANEVDAIIGNYSFIADNNQNRLSKKYREYDFVIEREKRNKELRRYFATKPKRSK